MLAQIDVAMMLIAFIIISFIKEPNIKSKELGKDKEIFLQSLKTIITQPWLVRATMSKLLLFFAGFFIFRTYQPLLHINGATVTIIGCFYLVTRGGIFLTHWYSGNLVNFLGTARWINGSAVIAIAGLVVTLVSQNIWLWIVPFAIASVMIDVRDPLFSKAINDRIDSRNRATTISILNMAKAVFDIPLLLFVGWLTTYSINFSLIAAIVACGIAVIFFWSKEKEFESINL
ncbi:MAG: hypothetical protein P1P90_03035 [Patescibacteria group bacterium]|nr:hypothetical protein [Patescibacteria group bacterium]